MGIIEYLDDEIADPALKRLLENIAQACAEISHAIRVQAIDTSNGGTNLSGSAESINVQGEQQMKVDIFAHEVFAKACKDSRTCVGLISEEMEDFIDLREEIGESKSDAKGESTSKTEGADERKYIVAFDPLDGSTNVAYGVSVGSIFSVFACKKGVSNSHPMSEVLKPATGRDILCAGYCVYGSSTDLIVSTRNNSRVVGWTLDPTSKSYLKTRKDIRIPSKGKIYSINEGYEHKFCEGMKGYIRECKSSANFTARYVGSMVADVHRTLLAGGTFHYPLCKLRMLYECFPMALVIEVSGGKSICDKVLDTLDSSVDSIHQRGAIHLGSKEGIAQLKKFLMLQ